LPGGAPDVGQAGTTPSSDAGSGVSAEEDGPGEAGPGPPALVVTNESVQVEGDLRTYVLVAPKVVAVGKRYPVIFVFHGDGGSGAAQRAAFEIDHESEDAALVVYPDGREGSFDLYTPEASNEDDAFVDAMLVALRTKYDVDTTRIFGSGFSSGAFFVNQLACRRTGFFRAIAPNAGGAPEEPEDPTASSWPGGFTRCANQTGGVAAFIVHGSEDFVVGQTSGDYDAKYWAQVNGCDPSAEDRTPIAPTPCVQHASCPTGKSVVYCEIPGMGHAIWSESVKASWAFFAAQ
jgi:polyhydroxybutyrate depolymerase